MAANNNFQEILGNYLKKTTGPVGPHDCLLWTGCKKEGRGKLVYGRVVNPFPDLDVQRMHVHRAVYYLSVGQSPAVENEPKSEISHLCHTPLCIKPSHLVKESHTRNQERMTCKAQGHCTGGHAPPCLL